MAHEILSATNYESETLDWLREHFEISQRYYKNTFVFNLESHSSVSSHCQDWLTSEDGNIDLQNNCQDPNKHLDLCENCTLIPQLFTIMMGFCNLIEEKKMPNDLLQIQKWRNRINDAEKAVIEWRNFMVRNKVSEEDWELKLTTDNPNQAQATFDFAMDHIPEVP